MKTSLLLLFFPALLLLFSCKKNKTPESPAPASTFAERKYSITLLDAIDSQPLKNISIDGKVRIDGADKPIHLVTDSTGYACFTSTSTNVSIDAAFDHPDYFQNRIGILNAIYMWPRAVKVVVHLKNTNPCDDNDAMMFSAPFSLIYNGWATAYSFQGTTVDTVVVYKELLGTDSLSFHTRKCGFDEYLTLPINNVWKQTTHVIVNY